MTANADPSPSPSWSPAAAEFFRLDTGTDAGPGVVELVLQRPERMNTLAPAFFPALRDTVRALDAAGETRVLLLRGEGKHFSAGMALDVFATQLAMLDTSDARKRLAFQSMLRELIDCVDVLDQARFPVVCAVQGACVGGALDLAAACDLRLASADAFFTVQEIHIGMAADLGVLQRLQKQLPQAVAREMAYTGDKLGAPRALACGFVNEVLPDGEALLAAARAMARRIAEKSPLAIATSKLAMNHARDHGVEESLRHMAVLQSAVFDLGEMGKAIAGWKGKRVAEFEPLGTVPGTEGA